MTFIIFNVYLDFMFQCFTFERFLIQILKEISFFKKEYKMKKLKQTGYLKQWLLFIIRTLGIIL